MAMVWYLKYRRWKLRRTYAKEFADLKARKASSVEFGALVASEHYDLQEADSDIDYVIGTRLYDEARSLDVETPPIDDTEMWVLADDGEHRWFSYKARAQVRKLVDAEKARRFEVKTLWVMKLILPLIAASVGIIGAITGLIAVLHRK